MLDGLATDLQYSAWATDMTSSQYTWYCLSAVYEWFPQSGDFRWPVTAPNHSGGPDRVLTVNGPRRFMRLAQRCMEVRAKPADLGLLTFGDDEEPRQCPICRDEASQPPVHLDCRHTFCEGCFQQHCESYKSNRLPYTIRCPAAIGGNDFCRRKLPIDEIRDNLSALAFEDLLQESFNAHVGRSAAELRWCPSPDCQAVYRVAAEPEDATFFDCHDCFNSVCTWCHQQHAGEPCPEPEDIMLDDDENGEIKQCPRCATVLERDGGCDTMLCAGCRAAICWLCVACFDLPGDCYRHVTREHYGIEPDMDFDQYNDIAE